MPIPEGAPNMDNKEIITAEKKRLAEVCLALHEAFSDDKAVLESIAHGIPVVNKDITAEPQDDAYNLSLPDIFNEKMEIDDEKLTALYEHLKNIKVVLTTCSDRRQAYESWVLTGQDSKPEEIVVLAVAAGAAQPAEYKNRQDALLNFYRFVGGINSKALFLLTGHDHRCGGQEKMMQLYSVMNVQENSELERNHIANTLGNMADQLPELEDRVSLDIFHIDDEGNVVSEGDRKVRERIQAGKN